MPPAKTIAVARRLGVVAFHERNSAQPYSKLGDLLRVPASAYNGDDTFFFLAELRELRTGDKFEKIALRAKLRDATGRYTLAAAIAFVDDSAVMGVVDAAFVNSSSSGALATDTLTYTGSTVPASLTVDLSKYTYYVFTRFTNTAPADSDDIQQLWVEVTYSTTP